MKNKIIFSLLVILGAIGIYLFSQYGFLQLKLPENTNNQTIQYKILDQDGNEIYSKSTTSVSTKKLVKKGKYQVSVSQNNKNSYSVLDTAGFLQTTTSEPELKAENSRMFVGNNPNFCMQYENEILYSSYCTEPGGLMAHLPATSKVPTTAQAEMEGAYLPSKGLISLNDNDNILITEEEDASVSLYNIDSSLSVNNQRLLNDISSDEVGGIMNYTSGFIVYSPALSELKYFESPTSTPKRKTILLEKETKNPVQISVLDKEIGVLFNDTTEGGDDDFDNDNPSDPAVSSNGKSAFVIYDGGGSYVFDKLYTTGGFCGSSKLCLFANGAMDMYDISGEKAEYLFSIKNALKALPYKGDIIIATDSGVLALDENSLEGSKQITYPTSRYCGINLAKSGYVLCRLDKKDNKAALYIDTSKPDPDSIEKKIDKLLDDPNISSVSAYKNFIYISPNLGELVYNAQTNGYDYPQDLVNSVNKKIDGLINKTGIDTSVYTVINPYN